MNKQAFVKVIVIFALFAAILPSFPAAGAGEHAPLKGLLDAKYAQLGSDTPVSSQMKTILSTSLTLSAAQFVMVNSDGRLYPTANGTLTNVWIDIDGSNVTNNAIIDYRGIIAQHLPGQQHSFNLVGGAQLAVGAHTIRLMAAAGAGAFSIGAGTNLSVMVRPATSIQYQRLGADTAGYGFNTQYLRAACEGGSGGHTGPAPHAEVLAANVTLSSANQPVIVLASGRAYKNLHIGDVMTGIYADGVNKGNNYSQWAVTDVAEGAEIQAPVYSQALFTTLSAGSHRISFDASEYPWGNYNNWTENPANYKIGANSNLLVLQGGFTLVGGAYKFPQNQVDCWGNMQTIATNLPGYEYLPKPNTDYKYLEKTFTVPAGHNGKIMFMAKTRMGCAYDEGGVRQDNSVNFLWLTIDGVQRGSTGVQAFVRPDTGSTRVIGASYLSANAPLAPGNHTVRVYTRVETAPGASIRGCGVSPDLTLIYFD